jgi:hypothetical protein
MNDNGFEKFSFPVYSSFILMISIPYTLEYRYFLLYKIIYI